MLSVLSALSAGQAGADVTRYDEVLTPIGDFVDSRVLVTGAGLRIVEHGTVTVDQYWGVYNQNTSVRIASASKWLSAAAIMTLVDDGLIDLDAPVSQYLPTEFAGQGDKATMTMRQMFSHTSGLPSNSSYAGDKSLTLASSVELIASNVALEAAPGSQFTYGQVSMHVAGRVAEVVTGQSWHVLFQERITGPLGMASTDFYGLGVTDNPLIAGGARSSVHDYSLFLEMLLAGGVAGSGERILSEQAIDTMLAEQTAGAAAGEAFDGYTLGSWINGRDEGGDPIEWSSPGLFGAVPWIHRDREVYGFFLVNNLLTNVRPLVDDIRAVARTPMPGDFDDDGDVDGVDISVMFSNFNGPGGGVPANPYTDLDGDGDADGVDVVTVFGLFTGPLSPVNVPEPSTAVLFGAVSLALTRRRRIRAVA